MINQGLNHAEVIDNRKLLLTFISSEIKIFDITPHINEKMFIALSNYEEFCNFTIDVLGGIRWKSGAYLSPDTLYLSSISLPCGNSTKIRKKTICKLYTKKTIVDIPNKTSENTRKLIKYIQSLKGE